MGKRAMDIIKVVAGVVLIVIAIIVFIDSNPVIQNYIRQREYVKKIAVKEANEEEVDIEESIYEEQLNNTDSNPQHIHSFVVITKLVLVQDEKGEVMEETRQYYSCDCGLELEMKRR